MIVSGCNKDESDLSTCGINGIIDAYGGYGTSVAGFKITLENISNSSEQHIAISDANGQFTFQDIKAGIYTISATKDGYNWTLMIDDGTPNHQNRIIELKAGHTKEIKILMRNDNPYTSDFELELTDIYGNPIYNSIHVPKYATTVAFRLYNGTDTRHSWSVDAEDCFVADDIGVYYEYVFSSFSETSGSLNPGESTIIVGSINQDIFNIYSNYPDLSHSYLVLSFWSDLKYMNVTLDIDF